MYFCINDLRANGAERNYHAAEVLCLGRILAFGSRPGKRIGANDAIAGDFFLQSKVAVPGAPSAVTAGLFGRFAGFELFEKISLSHGLSFKRTK